MHRFSTNAGNKSEPSVAPSVTSNLPETPEQLIQEIMANPNCLASYAPKDLAYFYRLPGEEKQTREIQHQILFLMFNKSNALSSTSSLEILHEVLTWQTALVAELYIEFSKKFNVRDYVFKLNSHLITLFNLESMNYFSTQYFIAISLDILDLIARRHSSLDDLRSFLAPFSDGLASVPITVKNNQTSRYLLNFREKYNGKIDKYNGALSSFLPKLCRYAVQFADPSDSAVFAHLLLKSARWILEPVFSTLANKNETIDFANRTVGFAMINREIIIERKTRLLTMLQIASHYDKEMELTRTNLLRLTCITCDLSDNMRFSDIESWVVEILSYCVLAIEHGEFQNLFDLLTEAKKALQPLLRGSQQIDSDSVFLSPLFYKLTTKIAMRLLDLTTVYVNNTSVTSYTSIMEALVNYASLVEAMTSKLKTHNMPPINSPIFGLKTAFMLKRPNHPVAWRIVKSNLEKYMFSLGSSPKGTLVAESLLLSANNAILESANLYNNSNLPPTINDFLVMLLINTNDITCYGPEQLAIIYNLPGHPVIAGTMQTKIISLLDDKMNSLRSIDSMTAYFQTLNWANNLVVDLPQQEAKKWIPGLVQGVCNLILMEDHIQAEPWHSTKSALNIFYILNKMQFAHEKVDAFILSMTLHLHNASSRMKNNTLSHAFLTLRKEFSNAKDPQGKLTAIAKEFCHYATHLIDYSDNTYNHAELLFELARWNLEPLFGNVLTDLPSLKLSIIMIENAARIDPQGINLSFSTILSMAIRLAASHQPSIETNPLIKKLLMLAAGKIVSNDAKLKQEFEFAVSVIGVFFTMKNGAHGLTELKTFLLTIRDHALTHFCRDNSVQIADILKIPAFFQLIQNVKTNLFELIEIYKQQPVIYAKILDTIFALAKLIDAGNSSENAARNEILQSLNQYFQRQTQVDSPLLILTKQAAENYFQYATGIFDGKSCLDLQETLRLIMHRQSAPVNSSVAPPRSPSGEISTPDNSASPLSFLAAIAIRSAEIKETKMSDENNILSHNGTLSQTAAVSRNRW